MTTLVNASQVKSQAKENDSQAQATEGLSGSAMSALGYFCGIIAIVALCVEPYNKDPKVRFNAMQAILLQASYFVGFIALGIFASIVGAILTYLLSAMNMFGTLGFIMSVFPIVTLLLSLAVVGVNIYLIVAAAKGGTPRVPVVSNFAQKFLGKK